MILKFKWNIIHFACEIVVHIYPPILYMYNIYNLQRNLPF